jgi:hypothetical protein
MHTAKTCMLCWYLGGVQSFATPLADGGSVGAVETDVDLCGRTGISAANNRFQSHLPDGRSVGAVETNVYL